MHTLDHPRRMSFIMGLTDDHSVRPIVQVSTKLPPLHLLFWRKLERFNHSPKSIDIAKCCRNGIFVKSNETAKRLYFRYGFEIVDELKKTYNDTSFLVNRMKLKL